ncbi:MAG: hypothetical protein KC547_17495, partial [Anaerolineae bacterium]|nr:hypothetical protein [Anaerolineae bacterium]
KLVTQLAARLESLFGRDNVIRDVDRLDLRTASRLVLVNEVLSTCSHVLILIGPRWHGNEHISLDNSRDPVRIELEAALKKTGLTLLPVLVEDASMPRTQDLPASLAALGGLSPVNFGADLEVGLRRVIDLIRGRSAHSRAWLWPAVAAAILVASLIVLLIVLTRP